MIKLMRIDERLIHGQVANEWSRKLAVNAIVVANDEAASNDLIKMSLKMAAPQGMKVVIKTVDESIRQLNDPRAAHLEIFVVVNCPEDALKIIKNVPGVPLLNVGNFGRVGKEKMNRNHQLTSNLYVNDQEIGVFREIVATGVECEFRTLITDSPISIQSLIDKK